MDEEKPEKCLDPKVENSWERKKTFFEVAAAQSSAKNVNPDLPDSLVAPLITVLDPCTVRSAIHTKVDWNLVKARLIRGHILNRRPRPVRAPGASSNSEALSTDAEGGSSDGGTSPGSSPSNRRKRGDNIRGEPMDTSNSETSKDVALRREKNVFIDEIVDLVRSVKKHNDASLSSGPTWIDRLHIERISKQLIMLQNYQPALLTIDEIVNGLLFENGPDVMENLLIEMPENLVTIVTSLITNPTPGSRTRYRNLMIGKIVTLYPYFARQIVYKFAERRSDCVFACRLAVDHFSDTQFLEFLEPMLTDKDTIIYKIVIGTSNRQVLPLVIVRLLTMADFVLNPPPESPSSVPSEMGVAPWCTSLSYCLVELMNSAMEPWREREVVTVTKFVFRTSIKPSGLPNINEPQSSSMDDLMDISFRDDLPSSQDSIVPDSDPESSKAHQRSSQLRPGGNTDDTSPFGDAHECFVLAALIAVPFFTQFPPNQTGAVQPPDRAVDAWLEVSRRRVLTGEKVTTTFGTHLIYVQTCIMASRIEQLAEFATKGIKQKGEMTIRLTHSPILRNTFATRCLTEMEVAKRSICQQATKSSAGNTALALRSIHSLQSAGVYKAFQMSIRPWLEQQLDCISLPASKLLADVVDGFANSSANGKGLSEQYVKNTFSGDVFDSRTIPKRLFVLSYMSAYREYCQKHDSSLRNSQYDISIYQKMSVRYLLSILEHRHKDFEEVRSRIIIRIASIYPYCLPTPESIRIVAENQDKAHREIIEEEQFGRVEKDNTLDALRENKNINKVLEVINRSSVREQLAAIPIVINVFMESLKPSTPPGFEQPLMEIFDRIEQIEPYSLFLLAASTWIEHDSEIDVEDVMKIPSLLFRSDVRILSSPPHFHCFIRTLNFFNRRCRVEHRLKLLEISHKITLALANPNRERPDFYRMGLDLDRKEAELMTGAYLDSQQSVLIHALVEVCDSKRMKDDPSDFSLREKRQRVRQIACDFIHRQFVDYDGLIRVVLHQRLPLRQVRDLVEGVPALFAGNSHILEMLSLADQERRFFAIVFAAEICRKYRVRESLETARIVCDIVHSLHKFGELPSSFKIWKHVAPALMLLATEFPSLADSINRLLIRVSTTAKNRLSVRCGMYAGDPRHEEFKLISTISSFLDRNATRRRL